MSKTKKTPKYKNIPVKVDVYAKVQLIAEVNGFGERGLGAQVAHWVGQELPECEHEKVPVSIETFPNGTTLVKSQIVYGYFCETCKRVYRHIEIEEFSPADREEALLAGLDETR